jgi:hypothetical protein
MMRTLLEGEEYIVRLASVNFLNVSQRAILAD